MGERIRGMVKFYREDVGFGFVTRDGHKDVFIHASRLPSGTRGLLPKQIISYELESHLKGPRARDIKLEE